MWRTIIQYLVNGIAHQVRTPLGVAVSELYSLPPSAENESVIQALKEIRDKLSCLTKWELDNIPEFEEPNPGLGNFESAILNQSISEIISFLEKKGMRILKNLPGTNSMNDGILLEAESSTSFSRGMVVVSICDLAAQLGDSNQPELALAETCLRAVGLNCQIVLKGKNCKLSFTFPDVKARSL